MTQDFLSYSSKSGQHFCMWYYPWCLGSVSFILYRYWVFGFFNLMQDSAQWVIPLKILLLCSKEKPLGIIEQFQQPIATICLVSSIGNEGRKCRRFKGAFLNDQLDTTMGVTSAENFTESHFSKLNKLQKSYDVHLSPCWIGSVSFSDLNIILSECSTVPFHLGYYLSRP